MVTPEQSTLPQLVVLEDHTDLREEMLDYLTSRGYAVWGVGSAEALYKQLLHKPMDILLADLCLPGEDGLEVIEHIRALKRCGIIAVTARGPGRNVWRAWRKVQTITWSNQWIWQNLRPIFRRCGAT